MGARPGTLIEGQINMGMLNSMDVVRVLRMEVQRAGSQSAWARMERIDRTLVNRVLRGHKAPTEEIVRALKLCKFAAQDSYRRKA
jgi:hypothetical protein